MYVGQEVITSDDDEKTEPNCMQNRTIFPSIIVLNGTEQHIVEPINSQSSPISSEGNYILQQNKNIDNDQYELLLNDQQKSIVKIKDSTTHSYSCSLCKKKYKCRRSLIKHHQVHINDSPNSDKRKDSSKTICESNQIKQNTEETQSSLHSNLRKDECQVNADHKDQLSFDISQDPIESIDEQNTNRIEKEFFSKNYYDGDIGPEIEQNLNTLEEFLWKSVAVNECPNNFDSKIEYVNETEGKKIKKKLQTGNLITKHVCKFCGKHCPYACVLKAHEKLHTGESPFICKFCSKPFSYRAEFERHLKVHSNEQPFSCSLCKTKFKHKRSLNTHYKVQHQ